MAISMRRGYSQRLLFACVACPIFFGSLLNPYWAAAETNQGMFRLAFSRDTFSEVRKNDAMAAIKVWAAIIFKERGIIASPAPHIFNSVQEIAKALTTKKIDSISLPSNKYWKLRHLLDQRICIVGKNNGSITEEYILLVHKDSEIQRLEDLRGRSLLFFQNSRMSLASIWLDTVLVQAGLPRTVEFCRETSSSKLSNTVLPVFFRRADACVVTRSSFNTMCELNPQLKQRLKVLTSSPELVPSVFCFRKDFNDSIRQVILSELTQILQSPSGEQIMTLFQLGAFEAQPTSCLDSALKLLTTHERLLDKTKTAP